MFQLTSYTPYWSMILSLLHLVGLRPQVYYTLTNFRGGGGKALLGPPQYTNAHTRTHANYAYTTHTQFYAANILEPTGGICADTYNQMS